MLLEKEREFHGVPQKLKETRLTLIETEADSND